MNPKNVLGNPTKLLLLFFSIFILSCINNNANNIPVLTSKNDSAKLKEPIKVIVDSNAIKFERKPVNYDSNKTYIYLTFDDGPGHGTMNCLDVCKKEGIKASFFMVGKHANDSWGQQTIKTIRNAYPQFLLSNHSYTHTNEKYVYFYSHPLMAEQDFYKAQESLNVPYKIIRLPGNNAWVTKDKIRTSKLVKPVCQKLNDAGFNVIGWDVEWNFTKGNSFPVQSPQQVAAQVKNAASGQSFTKKHIVILTHDRMFRTPEYANWLSEFIKTLKQNSNFVFETIDNYPNLKF